MSFVKSFVAAGAFVAISCSAQAASFAPGNYQAIDYNGVRSIWTPNGGNNPSGKAFVQGNGASALWSFSSDSRFNFDGTNATLTGTATNTGNSALAFDFSLDFTSTGTGTEIGFCQFDGATGACDGSEAVDPTMWEFFVLDEGSFTGIDSTVTEGLSWTLASVDAHKPQAGLGANALEEEDLGFSMWITWTLDGASADLARDGFTFNYKGKGDINIDVATVPLPTPALLLLTALGAGVFLGRRKKAA
ncbi:MAG: hypothetical protein AAGE89_06720 [Pseudomonadota bacterium]